MNNLIEKSIKLYKEGKLDQAQKLAAKSLQQSPTNASAHINMGNIGFLKKNYKEALEYYLKADNLRQDYYYSKINLANVYSELHNYDLAIFYAKQALNLQTDSKLGYQILGACYLEQKKYDDSISNFLHALKLDSSDAWIYNFLSQSYQKKGAFDDALRAGWEAIKLSPNDDSHHINFGYLLYECDLEKAGNQAKEYAAKWLHRFDDNSIANHMGNALLSNQRIVKANADYLAQIFDVFSSDFDDVLKDLDYQVPNLIAQELSKIYNKKSTSNPHPLIPNPCPKLKILDLGCGTGLCGEFLRNYKCWHGLEGLDISTKMLGKAKAKKLYDKLHHAELEDFIATKKNAYNLIVAADVFTYIGDLGKLFLSIHKSLKKNGRVLFSVAENNINDNGFFLTPSGRFVHSRLYVENIATEAGFAVEFSQLKKLRIEGDSPVFGYIVHCKKIPS